MPEAGSEAAPVVADVQRLDVPVDDAAPVSASAPDLPVLVCGCVCALCYGPGELDGGLCPACVPVRAALLDGARRTSAAARATATSTSASSLTAATQLQAAATAVLALDVLNRAGR
jgi:hypothetical protein